MAGASDSSGARPSAKVNSFSVSVRTNNSGRLQQRLFQSGDARELAAVGQPAGRVDRLAFFHHAPAAHGVELFQRKAHRIDQPMATRAGGVGAMLGQALADGQARRLNTSAQTKAISSN